MNPPDFHDKPLDLEDAFFVRENARLLEGMRRKADEKARRQQLSDVVRVKDEAFLDRLMALGITPATVLALQLIPLLFVAWADGRLDEKEREAVLRAARGREGTAEEATIRLIGDWLAHEPEPRLLELWKEYVRQIWGKFTRDEQWRMRENVLKSAREVAEASGGFLRLTARTSAEERKVIEEFERLLA